jgi:ABC-2 type transport system ATP-binding protein
MTQSPRFAVQVSGLVKDFGGVHAVRGIDFAVEEREMFGFLGPNGAGKSTTIKILCTLAEPTAGTATVAGHDVVAERSLVRRSIGLVFQEPTLDQYLTGRQNLSFHGELYGVPKAVLRRRIDEILEMVGLSDRADDKVQTFSGGMKRRLEIGRGLLHSPRVLFLDEPTIGLDPVTRASIWDYVARLREAEDITVFVTTHYMDEAEHCDRIAIMNNGELAVIDTPDALKSSIGMDRVQFRTDDDERAIAEVRERFGLEAAMHNGALTIQVPAGAEFVPRLFAELSTPITTVTVTRPSLDDVFMTYTGTTISDAEKPKAGTR